MSNMACIVFSTRKTNKPSVSSEACPFVVTLLSPLPHKQPLVSQYRLVCILQEQIYPMCNFVFWLLPFQCDYLSKFLCFCISSQVYFSSSIPLCAYITIFFYPFKLMNIQCFPVSFSFLFLSLLFFLFFSFLFSLFSFLFFSFVFQFKSMCLLERE